MPPMAGGVGPARPPAAGLLDDPPRLAVLALCAVVLGLRRAEAWSRPQFWAEDAHFYERAYVTGWHALTLPYAGYLHTIPRAVAGVAVHLDPAIVPGFFVGCATLLTLYVASLALSGRCPLPRFAGLCALAVALVPDTHEVLLNIVNLQWVLAAGLILVLLSRDPAGAGQRVHDSAAVVALGLTGPFCIIVAPLFVGRAWSRGTRASAALAGLVVACALVQGYVIHREPPADPGLPTDPVAVALVLPAIGHRVLGSIVLGPLVPLQTPAGIGDLLGAATLLGVAYLGLRPGPLRRERIMLALAFAGVLASSLYRTRHGLGEYFKAHGNSRYFYLPQLIAIWLLLCAAAGRDRAARGVAAVLFLGFLANLPRLREPALADLHWELYAPRIRAGEAVRVPVNPRGWVMPLPARTN